MSKFVLLIIFFVAIAFILLLYLFSQLKYYVVLYNDLLGSDRYKNSNYRFIEYKSFYVLQNKTTGGYVNLCYPHGDESYKITEVYKGDVRMIVKAFNDIVPL